jgi:hypothetical protein
MIDAVRLDQTIDEVMRAQCRGGRLVACSMTGYD